MEPATMPTPLFSIVIPTYNRADILGTSIQSVLDQTLGDFEIVVSDNHSEDGTKAVVSGFKDRRIRYVRPPRHMAHVDHFEFVWRQARGTLIVLLGDDDALLGTALEQFMMAAERFDADFLFCSVAEYRSSTFPGPLPNTVDCPPFTAVARGVGAEEYLRPYFAFRSQFVSHPTAYVFARALAERVTERTGHFFWTRGIETYAWPMAAALARNLAYVDAPLGIMGRTHQSFGSNTALCNPGKKRIQEAISDYGSTFEFAPLRTMAFPNLMWDGIVGAKLTAPELFAGYELDEPQYLRATASRLKFMHSLGVDVGDDMTELLEYAKRHPELSVELSRQEPAAPFSFVRRARQILGDMGARKVTARLHAFRQLQRLRRGRSKALGTMSGDMLGFNDILGCARFLTPFVSHEIVNGARRAS